MRRWSFLVLAGCGRVAFAPLPASDAQAVVAPDAEDLSRVYDLSTCPADLVLVGDAACAAGGLELTPDAANRTGAFWIPMPWPTDVSLAIEATVSIETTGPVSADGLAVVLHGDVRGSAALGGFGGGNGYEGITPSVAIEVDHYVNPAETEPHLAVHLDGDDDVPLATAPSSIELANGVPLTVWIDYDASIQQLRAVLGRGMKPVVPMLSLSHPMARFGSTMWLGMTAATGIDTAVHRVHSLRVTIVP